MTPCPRGVTLVFRAIVSLSRNSSSLAQRDKSSGCDPPTLLIAAVDDDVVIGRMLQHQVRWLAHLIENAALEDVEARMHIEAVRLDAHLPRDLSGCTAADHRIGKDAPNKSPFAAMIVLLHVKTQLGNSRHFVFFCRYGANPTLLNYLTINDRSAVFPLDSSIVTP